MLHYFSFPYIHTHHLANLLHYVSFRSAIAVFVSLFLSIIFGSKIISFLKNYQKDGQPIRDDGPETHHAKSGTPTMGGIIIIISSLISCLLCAEISNPFVLVSLFVFLSFGFLGFWDDYLKIVKKNHKGVSAKLKFIVQMFVSVVVYIVVKDLIPEKHDWLFFPLFKKFHLELGILFFPFVMLVISGASNAVNLTDGLDGLAIVPFGITTFCFGIIAYFAGTKLYADYLHILYIPRTAELAVVCSSLIGSSLGFLWFNAKPAEIFMGDTGSLALGGFLGVISILTKQEIILSIAGGLFVIEALSVILQVGYFKLTKGKRIFKMAPIHHHYEKLGWSETKVVTRFWIISLIFAIIALISLKIR
jgi:phospho-N-acetylmuramoyl-pentapeptide-transferase